MKTIDLITLGCSKNLVDSEYVIRQFEANGYRVAHDPETPRGKIAIINTCGFIGDAKEESINVILAFARRKQQGKLDKLFVMGCLSERYREELKAEIPEVDKFYGKFDYQNIVKELTQNYRSDLRLERTLTTPKHYAYVKISEGCNRRCSYCAIPIMTGKYLSRPMEDVVNEVTNLTKQGVKEFQLIAQDLSYYGKDLYQSLKLAELTKRLSDIEGVEWLRLHYAYPADFPYDVLPVMRERDNVCKYLDIAFQHISDPMLKKMRRGITQAQTYELIEQIRTEVPDIHLRTTLMTGHPQETAADFEALKTFVQKARFERMGAFKYSAEEGTHSYIHYKDDILEDEKQRRLDEIMAMQQDISQEINQRKIGQTLKVIIDREDEDFFVGRTQFDSPEIDPEVLVEKNKSGIRIGNFYDVKITAAEEIDLYGRML